MTGKRAENVLEIRDYIKGRSLLGIKAVDIHREVCDIYGEGQMSYRTVCRCIGKDVTRTCVKMTIHRVVADLEAGEGRPYINV